MPQFFCGAVLATNSQFFTSVLFLAAFHSKSAFLGVHTIRLWAGQKGIWVETACQVAAGLGKWNSNFLCNKCDFALSHAANLRKHTDWERHGSSGQQSHHIIAARHPHMQVILKGRQRRAWGGLKQVLSHKILVFDGRYASTKPFLVRTMVKLY